MGYIELGFMILELEGNEYKHSFHILQLTTPLDHWQTFVF